MSEQATQRQEVRVGERLDGVFLGEVVRFTGEKLGSYPEFEEESRRCKSGATWTLYQCPDGYRVHTLWWENQQPKEAELEPTVHPDSCGPDEKQPVYDLFPEAEARELSSDIFAALGMPNIRELD